MEEEIIRIKRKDNFIEGAKLGFELGKNYVVCKGCGIYLTIRSDECWKIFERKLYNLHEKGGQDSRVRMFCRHFLATACDCEMEADGYMEIPDNLLAFVEPENEKNIDELLVIQGVDKDTKEPIFFIGYRIDYMRECVSKGY